MELSSTSRVRELVWNGDAVDVAATSIAEPWFAYAPVTITAWSVGFSLAGTGTVSVQLRVDGTVIDTYDVAVAYGGLTALSPPVEVAADAKVDVVVAAGGTGYENITVQVHIEE